MTIGIDFGGSPGKCPNNWETLMLSSVIITFWSPPIILVPQYFWQKSMPMAITTLYMFAHKYVKLYINNTFAFWFSLGLAIHCFECYSVDGSNKDCEDEFGPYNQTGYLLHRKCEVGYLGFEAFYCVKIKGTRCRSTVYDDSTITSGVKMKTQRNWAYIKKIACLKSQISWFDHKLNSEVCNNAA